MRPPQIRKCSIVLLILIFALLAAGALAHEEDEEHGSHKESHSHEDEGHAHEEEEEHKTFVPLSAETTADAEVSTQIVGPHVIRSTLTLLGEVTFDEENLVHVFPRFSGMIRKIGKKIGDEVKPGDVLAVVESNESLSPYEIKAETNGTVIKKHLAIGEFAKDDQELYSIANLNSMWVKVSLYPQDMEKVKIGAPAEVNFDSGKLVSPAVINYVSPELNELTRTGEARLVLANPSRAWKRGMFVSVDVVVNEHPASIAVPAEAVVTLKEGGISVFVRGANEEGKEGFQPRSVKVGAKDSRYVEILEGLRKGETIATSNAFMLKAELEGVPEDDD